MELRLGTTGRGCAVLKIQLVVITDQVVCGTEWSGRGTCMCCARFHDSVHLEIACGPIAIARLRNRLEIGWYCYVNTISYHVHVHGSAVYSQIR